MNSFNFLGVLASKNQADEAIHQLVIASECDEVGLGHSGHRRGKRIRENQARDILALFGQIDQYRQKGFLHLEEIQFFMDGIARDRISDLACNFMKSFLIDFTVDQCDQEGLPLADTTIPFLYDQTKRAFLENVPVRLPVNPEPNEPIIFVPKRWLRFGPWLDFEEYFRDYCPRDRVVNPGEDVTRVKVLNFNRDNYGAVEAYIKEKERTAADCHNDPLFSQIPIVSAKRAFAQLKELPSGKTDSADREYEELASQLLASLLYPHLDFAQTQSRTDSGVLIRDLVFYNNRSHEFLKEVFDDYGSRQLVMELKNVASVERDHINQLNRYLSDDFGRFGVLVTRQELSAPRRKSVIDLWAGQRRAIISLTDDDVEQMVELYETKQRLPLDVLKKKYVQFRRACPA